jgi:type VI secretion system protein ImpM
MSLAFWRQTETKLENTYSLFGKMPSRADFLRINATVPIAQEYDQRLQEAIVKFSQEPGWEAAYDITGTTLFAYRGTDKQAWFIGGQRPSRDQQSRRFPLVAGMARTTANIGNNLPFIPLSYEVFFSGLAGHLENAIENSVDAVTCRAFMESFSGNADRTGADFELASALFSKFVSEKSVEDLQEILRIAYPHAEIEQAIINIAFYTNFVRHYPNSAAAQEIVLPLPRKQGTNALVAAVWLKLVGYLSGNIGRIAGFFFRSDFIVIVVDVFSHDFSPLLPLLYSVKGRGLMLTAEHETWKAHPLHPEISYALTRLMTDSQASLQSVFDCAQQIGIRLLTSE